MNITIRKDLTAAPDAIWDLLAERFADIGTWASFLVGSSLDGELTPGSVRTCNLRTPSAGSDTIEERINRFDRASRKLGYVVIKGMPGFMKLVDNQWSITETPTGGARVRSDLTVKLAWYAAPMAPVIRRQFTKLISGFIDELEQNAGPARGPHIIAA